MLVALFTLWLLGGSSTSLLDYIADTRDSVKTVMVKDERQKAALITLKAMKKTAGAHNKQAVKIARGLDKAFRDHAVSAGEINAIWDTYFTEVDQYNHDMIELRFELREHINREEWAAIFADEP